MGDLADQRPMTVKVSIRAKTVKDCQFLRRLLVQEEYRVLDDFHVSHSAVDGRPGRKFRLQRDASAPDTGHNFDRDELCFPPHIVKLTKQSGRIGTAIDQLKP